MKRNSLGYNERLKSKKNIDLLFAEGNSFYFKPFFVYWRIVDMEYAEAMHPIKMMVSVSKKYFGKAHNRNSIKRRIREGYRKNKYIIAGLTEKQQLSLSIIYTSNKILLTKKIEDDIILMLNYLSNIIQNEDIAKRS